jgi:hypothetical protein
MHYFGVGVHYKRDDRTESPYFQSHDKRRRPRLQYRLSAEEAVTPVESRYKEKAMTTVPTLGRRRCHTCCRVKIQEEVHAYSITSISKKDFFLLLSTGLPSIKQAIYL